MKNDFFLSDKEKKTENCASVRELNLGQIVHKTDQMTLRNNYSFKTFKKFNGRQR